MSGGQSEDVGAAVEAAELRSLDVAGQLDGVADPELAGEGLETFPLRPVSGQDETRRNGLLDERKRPNEILLTFAGNEAADTEDGLEAAAPTKIGRLTIGAARASDTERRRRASRG